MSNGTGWIWALAIGAIVFANYKDKSDDAVRQQVDFDELAARSAASADALLKTYPPTPGPTFGNYNCTQDCSGHAAGYEWAEENGIDDPNDCGGNSQSFIEGCEEYAEEQINSYDYGYSWAEDNGVIDQGECPSRGDDFASGCEEFVEDQGYDGNGEYEENGDE